MSTSLRLIAVGDISLGDHPLCPGFGIRSALSHGLNPFVKIKNIFTDADIVFGNLETVLSDHGLNRNSLSSWEMRGSPLTAYLLKEAGFTVLNIANNHIMQHGEVAFNETVNILNKLHISIIGLRDEASEGSKSTILGTPDHRVGFLAYAFEFVHSDGPEIPYAFGPAHDIKQEIQILRSKVRTLVVSCHWGLEFISRPSPITIMLARKLIDWGADIVIGHHPHVLQGVEYYRNGIIAYSLGNFLFDTLWNANLRNSSIFIFDINGDKINLEMIPIWISDSYILEKSPRRTIPSNDFTVMRGDIERNTLEYYREFERLRKVHRFQSILHFVFMLNRVHKKLAFQVVQRKFRSLFYST